MSSFPVTESAWAKLVANGRAVLAQVFLGWALAMDKVEVMETVVGGVVVAEKRCGAPPNSWARKHGLVGPWRKP